MRDKAATISSLNESSLTTLVEDGVDFEIICAC